MLLFNRYKYQPATDLIGKGELTRVYKALDTQIYLPVALKIIRGSDPLEKFGLVNVKKLISMDHANICRYLHIEEVEKDGPLGEPERTQVCVMELMPDGDFGNYYRERKDPELLRRMVTDILRGLSYLHSQGIVHRRLKPANLLVTETTEGPVVKITDFGLGSGKAAMKDARLSSVVVEVTHMAPEQLNPRKYGINGKVSYHLDFWAVGLVIYETLTNNDILFKNHPDESREQVIQNILSPVLPEKIRRLPSPFDKVVARCLTKQVSDRVQNTRELLELLSQPITTQDDVYETMVLPAMARMEEEEEMEDGGLMVAPRVAKETIAPKIVSPKMVTPMADRREVVSSMRSERSEEPHVLFNRYEYNPKTGFIGKGGFSRVYKALDRKLDRWVALKLYKSGESTERYSPFAEIRRVINLDHPNICRYLDIEEMEKENAFGEKEKMQICVMELLDGGNLLEHYTQRPTEEVLKKLLTDVLRGLEYLHKNGIIHRDIKPANILIKNTYDGPVAKITDFGISKLSDSINQHSSSALVVSIPYMAPEQLNVKKYGIDEKISYNLDLWSLGVTIYEIITGKVLFKNGDHETSEQIMTNIMAPELPEKINELPQPFLDIVRRCVVKNARERVQRADELIELLRRPVGEPVARPAVEPTRVEPVRVEPVRVEHVRVEPVRVEPVRVEPTRVESAGVEPAGVEPARSELLRNEPARNELSRNEPARVEPEMKGVPEPEPESRSSTEPWFPPESELHFEPEPEVVDIEQRAVPFTRVPKPRVARRRGWLVVLRVAIIVVAVLLGISIYSYIQNQRSKSGLETGSPIPTGSPAAPAAASAPPTVATSPGDSVKTAATVPTTTTSEGKKPHRGRKKEVLAEAGDTTGTEAGTDGIKEPVKSEKSGTTGTETAKYVLLLSTPTTCSININNVPYGVLESGKTMKVYLSPGNYIITATSTSNSSSVYTGRLVVQDDNLNQVGKYTIPL